MKTIKLVIRRVLIVESSYGMDHVCVFVDGLSSPTPTAYPNEEVSLDFKVEAGYGAAWVKDNFDVEPEIVKRPRQKVNFSKNDD